jgi:hypothetical protein
MCNHFLCYHHYRYRYRYLTITIISSVIFSLHAHLSRLEWFSGATGNADSTTIAMPSTRRNLNRNGEYYRNQTNYLKVIL